LQAVIKSLKAESQKSQSAKGPISEDTIDTSRAIGDQLDGQTMHTTADAEQFVVQRLKLLGHTGVTRNQLNELAHQFMRRQRNGEPTDINVGHRLVSNTPPTRLSRDPAAQTPLRSVDPIQQARSYTSQRLSAENQESPSSGTEET
jgi:hypothetical protein